MHSNARTVSMTLKLLYGLVPIAAGADKFTNILVDWTTYLPEQAASLLPVSPSVFMGVVGVIEIAAGILVLSKLTRIGAMVVSAWLLAIAANLFVAGYWDIAVRDIAMAIGAWSLSRLWEPSTAHAGATQVAPAHT